MIVDNGEGQWYDREDNMGRMSRGSESAVFLGVGYLRLWCGFMRPQL
jgi:hypothetical protein